MIVKGVEAANRTAISNPKVRNILKNMVDINFENKVLKETILKMKRIKNHEKGFSEVSLPRLCWVQP